MSIVYCFLQNRRKSGGACRIFRGLCQQCRDRCLVVKQRRHQLCSATSLLLFDALSMRRLDVLSIPKQIRIEHSSVAFLDCVEDGGACLLMSVGKGALLLWFFEVAVEPQITPSKAKNASTKPTLSSASSKRYVSIENSPEKWRRGRDWRGITAILMMSRHSTESVPASIPRDSTRMSSCN